LFSASLSSLSFFSFKYPATTQIYTLSLHDALPISRGSSFKNLAASLPRKSWPCAWTSPSRKSAAPAKLLRLPSPSRRQSAKRKRSEEHTSELQSRSDLVCRLLLEKKKNKKSKNKDK